MNSVLPAWPPLIAVERVLCLHEAAIAHAGGVAGVREMGLVKSAVLGALTAAYYANDKPDEPLDPLHIAAQMLISLARNHAFIDGNKRVAWLAMEEQLRLCRLRVVANPVEAEQMVLDVITKHLEIDRVVDWIAERLFPYEA